MCDKKQMNITLLRENDMEKEFIILSEERNVTLKAYLQEKPEEEKLPAVLVIPGGGYQVCADGEAEPPAFAYAKAGFQAFVLRYTVGEQCVWPIPLEDYEQAMETIRANADAWHVDPEKIAVAGFSAGGHLAACAATIGRNKPAAAVLVYPAVLRETLEDGPVKVPYPNELVTKETCPCFFAAARDDDTVDIKNTVAMEMALIECGIPFESHIYNVGGHAFSTGDFSPWGHELTPRLTNWVGESIGWLRETL